MQWSNRTWPTKWTEVDMMDFWWVTEYVHSQGTNNNTLRPTYCAAFYMSDADWGPPPPAPAAAAEPPPPPSVFRRFIFCFFSMVACGKGWVTRCATGSATKFGSNVWLWWWANWGCQCNGKGGTKILYTWGLGRQRQWNILNASKYQMASRVKSNWLSNLYPISIYIDLCGSAADKNQLVDGRG